MANGNRNKIGFNRGAELLSVIIVKGSDVYKIGKKNFFWTSNKSQKAKQFD